MHNFKTGIFVNEWKNYESESALIKGLERAASLGVDGVQLSDMCRLDKADSSFRKNIKSALDSLGLKVSAICGDIGIKFHNTERREELYDTLWRVYDIALELGTNIVTTHVGVVPADKTNPRYGVMAETFSHIAERAATLDAYLANETGPETAPVLKAFLDDINSPAAVNFAPANTAMSTGEKAEEAAKTLGKYIVHIHAKDGILKKHADLEVMYGVRRDPDFRESDYCREVLLGEGDVDWKKYLAALEEIGYTGYLTIEREGSSTHDADVEKEVPFLKALPELDAVSVCVWNCNHASCAIKALDAGKHVLCDKPLAMSVEEGKAMLDAAKRNDRLLMVGFCCRFENAADIIRAQQKSDLFGDIYYAKASYLRRNGAPGGWFCNTSMSGGGPMIDLGVHILDLTRYLMGNPKPVSVFGATFNKLGDRPGVQKPTDAYLCADNNEICDVEDLATALIRYDNGAVLFLESSYSLNIKDTLYSMELFGTKGGVRIAPDFELYKDVNSYMMDMTPAGIRIIDESACFPGEIGNFVDTILGRAECMAPAEDGLDILRILIAVYESARTGHEVLL